MISDLMITDLAILRFEEPAGSAEASEVFLLQGLGQPLAGLERFQEGTIQRLRDWDAERATHDKKLVLQNV